VDENIAVVVASDETKTLFGVVPLDSSGRHVETSLWSNYKKGTAVNPRVAVRTAGERLTQQKIEVRPRFFRGRRDGPWVWA
jgi:hypothetical protein